jgi:hypothetical protein
VGENAAAADAHLRLDLRVRIVARVKLVSQLVFLLENRDDEVVHKGLCARVCVCVCARVCVCVWRASTNTNTNNNNAVGECELATLMMKSPIKAFVQRAKKNPRKTTTMSDAVLVCKADKQPRARKPQERTRTRTQTHDSVL